ncbi:MAG: hypothetical protein IJD59_10415 [Clostridia bacterium]|nr:hypothetical protein [Clostridia bacterium]
MNNTSYKNKYFSILGDSISTLERHSVPEHASYYTHENCLETGVFIPADTWWGQVIDALGGKLMVNDSFSGSTVCDNPQYRFPSYGCSQQRTSNLGKYRVAPDVIMVFMGTNDWGRGTPISSEDDPDSPYHFLSAYAKMLDQLKRNYPSAEIWCMTLPVSTWSEYPDFRFPYRYGGVHIEKYCEAIRICAKKAGARLIDLYQYAELYDTVDGFHPNESGMKTLSRAILSQL